MRNMTPCTVDGIPAMYDSVEDKYYFNASSTVRIQTKNAYSPFIVGMNSEIDD